jgi:hypothetical protein
MVESAPARFAVGDFQTWDAAGETLRGLSALGVKMDAISMLGLRRLFLLEAGSQHMPARQLRELAFGQSPDVVCCTPGILAERLDGGLAKGAATVGNAFSRWLPPQAAQRIQQSINDGLLLVWVQVFDANDERRACTGLLTFCLNGVEVHDLLPFQPPTGNGHDGTITFRRKS